MIYSNCNKTFKMPLLLSCSSRKYFLKIQKYLYSCENIIFRPNKYLSYHYLYLRMSICMKIYRYLSIICVKHNKFSLFISFKQELWYNLKNTLNFKAT